MCSSMCSSMCHITSVCFICVHPCVALHPYVSSMFSSMCAYPCIHPIYVSTSMCPYYISHDVCHPIAYACHMMFVIHVSHEVCHPIDAVVSAMPSMCHMMWAIYPHVTSIHVFLLHRSVRAMFHNLCLHANDLRIRCCVSTFSSCFSGGHLCMDDVGQAA